MGTIVEFRRRVTADAESGVKSHRSFNRSAQILMFTGVRYERHGKHGGGTAHKENSFVEDASDMKGRSEIL